MIEKKLEALFGELNEEEINRIQLSDIDTECDIDPKIYSSVLGKVRAKTQQEVGVIPIVSVKEKQQHKQVRFRKLKAIFVAAAVFVVLAIGVGAAYHFIMPEGLNKELGLNDMHIKTVVDTGKADENSVRTMQKTVSDNGLTVTFEAVVDGYVILPDFIAMLRGYDDSVAEIREDRIYAVMTITRDDGKNVLMPEGYDPICFCCDSYFKFNVAVKGYAPYSTMLTEAPWYYEEGNVLYYLCDITEAAKFADHELTIIIFDGTDLDGTIARMDENGESYFVDTYDDFGVMFDLELDASLADPDAVKKAKELNPYSFDADPDYTIFDEMIAKDEALKKVDLSYAIGNHRWYGYDPMQFGDIPYAEAFIELFAKKSELVKTDIDALKIFIDEESAKLDAATVSEIERISGKDIELMTDDELNDIGDEIDIFIKENEKIKADVLRDSLDFVKFDDGSEYCYIDEFTFLYIPAGSDYAKIVIVYGDRIVISMDCTASNLFSVTYNKMPASTEAYSYLFGGDEGGKYEHIRSEQDAIFMLITPHRYDDGIVEVLRK